MFPDRAVEALRRNFEHGESSHALVNDVLRCKGQIDVSCLEEYLKLDYPEWVRCDAAKVVAQKGNRDVIIEAAVHEENQMVLIFMLGALEKRDDGLGLEKLAFLLNREGTYAKIAAITMFRKTGREDCLLPLLFSRSDSEVAKAKWCMTHERRH